MKHTTTGERRLVGALLTMLLMAGGCGDAKGDPVTTTDAGVAEAVDTDLVTTTATLVVTTVISTAFTATTATTTSTSAAVTTTTVPFPDIDEELGEFDDLEQLLDEIDALLGDSLEGEDS